jgi:hypothetical protein
MSANLAVTESVWAALTQAGRSAHADADRENPRPSGLRTPARARPEGLGAAPKLGVRLQKHAKPAVSARIIVEKIVEKNGL